MSESNRQEEGEGSPRGTQRQVGTQRDKLRHRETRVPLSNFLSDPEFKRRPAPEFRYRGHWRHRGWECCCCPNVLKFPAFSFQFGQIPNFSFQKCQLYCWIQPVPLGHMVLKGSRCMSWSGGLTCRNGKTNRMKTNSQRSLKSICVVTPISLREDKSYLNS